MREKGHLELIEDSCIEDEIPTVEPLVQPVSVTVETDETVIEIPMSQILSTSESAQVAFMIERIMRETTTTIWEEDPNAQVVTNLCIQKKL